MCLSWGAERLRCIPESLPAAFVASLFLFISNSARFISVSFLNRRAMRFTEACHRAQRLHPLFNYEFVVVNGHGHVHTTLTAFNLHVQGRVAGHHVADDHSLPLRSRRGRLHGPRRARPRLDPVIREEFVETANLTLRSSVLSASSCRRRWKKAGGGFEPRKVAGASHWSQSARRLGRRDLRPGRGKLWAPRSALADGPARSCRGEQCVAERFVRSAGQIANPEAAKFEEMSHWFPKES